MAKKSAPKNLVQRDVNIDAVAEKIDGLKIDEDAGKKNGAKSTEEDERTVNKPETQLKQKEKEKEELGGAEENEEKDTKCKRLETDNSVSEDEKTFRLLGLLNEYERLANDSMRVNFAQAYLDLSRANYYGSQRFNMDSVDMRPRDASTIVEWDQGMPSLKDKWQVYREQAKAGKGQKPVKTQNLELDKKEKKAKSDVEVEVKVGKTAPEKESAISSAIKEGTGLRNRKNPEKIERLGKIENLENLGLDSSSENSDPPQDPVYQFGRMVPMQLRNAQTHFQKALADSINLLRLQQEILLVVGSLGQ